MADLKATEAPVPAMGVAVTISASTVSSMDVTDANGMYAPASFRSPTCF